MAKDYVVIKGQANIIRNETAEGGNTAAEVGGAIYDVADKLEEVDGVLTAAIGTKLPTSSVVDDLASTSAAAPLSANQGRVLNETKSDKTTQVVAGNGLTGGGTLSGDVTVNVGNTDDSIVVGADGIKVDTQDSLTSTSTTKPLSAAQGKALQDNKVDTSRTITAGNGLTGGGNLTEDRTININPADDSLVVTADNVKVNTNNTLTSTSTTQPLSANQGKVLNEKVVQVETDLNKVENDIYEYNNSATLSSIGTNYYFDYHFKKGNTYKIKLDYGGNSFTCNSATQNPRGTNIDNSSGTLITNEGTVSFTATNDAITFVVYTRTPTTLGLPLKVTISQRGNLSNILNEVDAITDSYKIVDDNSSDFAVKDGNGVRIMSLKNGGIKTKRFDSTLANQNLQLSAFSESGDGTPSNPYISANGDAGFSDAIANMIYGGKVVVRQGIYNVSQPLVYAKKNINIEGDAWSYSNDPNGVYASNNGSKIKLTNYNICGIKFLSGNLSGGRIAQIGIAGMIEDYQTSGLFDPTNPTAHSGIAMTGGRIDQFVMDRVSFQGLSSGFVIENAEIDACIFKELNTDGCNIGIFVRPSATYYAKFKDSIIADCPSYGMYIANKYANITYMTISGLVLVRNGALTTESQKSALGENASLYVKGLSSGKIHDNEIHQSGLFKDYDGNGQIINPCVGLYIDANYTSICNNSISSSSSNAAIILGARNQFNGNQCYDDAEGLVLNANSSIISNNAIRPAASANYSIKIDGGYNYISDNYISSKPMIVNGSKNIIGFNKFDLANPKIIIGPTATNTVIYGLNAGDVQDSGINTTFK